MTETSTATDIPTAPEAVADEPAEATPETASEADNEPTADVPAQAAEPVIEQVAEPVAEVNEDKSRSKRPRKNAPRKAAGTKALVVLRDGRVQFVDTETVLVIDLDEAASPEADVHDVVDRLAELRDAVDCPGKADAVRALTELIQEKALG